MWHRGRRVLPVILALVVGTMCASWFPPASSRADVASLRDQLEKGLRARNPADFEFIDTVVLMVENGELPTDLVRSSFLWVRKNRAHKRYMVLYFEQVLRRRAAERGIEVPE